MVSYAAHNSHIFINLELIVALTQTELEAMICSVERFVGEWRWQRHSNMRRQGRSPHTPFQNAIIKNKFSVSVGNSRITTTTEYFSRTCCNCHSNALINRIWQWRWMISACDGIHNSFLMMPRHWLLTSSKVSFSVAKCTALTMIYDCECLAWLFVLLSIQPAIGPNPLAYCGLRSNTNTNQVSCVIKTNLLLWYTITRLSAMLRRQNVYRRIRHYYTVFVVAENANQPETSVCVCGEQTLTNSNGCFTWPSHGSCSDGKFIGHHEHFALGRHAFTNHGTDSDGMHISFMLP